MTPLVPLSTPHRGRPLPLAPHAAAARRGAIADIAPLTGSSCQLLTALSQPPYERSHHIGVVIGPDALSGIGRQDRPISGVGEWAKILILARHRCDNRNPLLLARIF